MGKSSGSTRTSTAGNPRGITTGGGRGGKIEVDTYRLPFRLKGGGNLRIPASKFTEADQYERYTKPMEVELDTDYIVSFWDRGLTGGDSRVVLDKAKSEIIKAVKKYSGETIKESDIRYDKDLHEFVAWHPAKKPGDTLKSYWKVDSVKATVVATQDIPKGTRGAYTQIKDSYRSPQHPSWKFKVKISGTGSKEY